MGGLLHDCPARPEIWGTRPRPPVDTPLQYINQSINLYFRQFHVIRAKIQVTRGKLGGKLVPTTGAAEIIRKIKVYAKFMWFSTL